MYWRFLHVANTKHSETPKKNRRREIPILSLRRLADDLRISGKADWESLHHEVGQVGLGRWGELCMEEFRHIKHTRRYQRWILQRRRCSSMKHKHPALASSPSPETPTHVDNPRPGFRRHSASTTGKQFTRLLDLNCSSDFEYLSRDGNSDLNDSTVDSEASFNASSSIAWMNLSNVQCRGRTEEPSCQHQAQTKKKTPVKSLYRSALNDTETECKETEKLQEQEVRDALVSVVNDVCTSETTGQVLESVVDAVSCGEEITSSVAHFSLAQNEHDVSIAMSDRAELSSDLQSRVRETMDYLDAVIQEHEMDQTRDNHKYYTSPAELADEFVRQYDCTYRNIKCCESAETVFRELERNSLERELQDISPQASSTNSGTVSVMFGKDWGDTDDFSASSEEEELDGIVEGPGKASETHPETNDLLRAKEKDEIASGERAIHLSSSPPYVSSPCITDVIQADLSSLTDEEHDSQSDDRDTTGPCCDVREQSLDVTHEGNPGESVEQVEVNGEGAEMESEGGKKKSCEKDIEGETDIDDESESVKKVEKKKESEIDHYGCSGDGVNRPHRKNTSNQSDPLTSGNARFLLDRSATDSELGIKLINLEMGPKTEVDPLCNSMTDLLSEASFKTIDNFNDRASPQNEDALSNTDTLYHDDCASTPRSTRAFQGKGGCHVS